MAPFDKTAEKNIFNYRVSNDVVSSFIGLLNGQLIGHTGQLCDLGAEGSYGLPDFEFSRAIAGFKSLWSRRPISAMLNLLKQSLLGWAKILQLEQAYEAHRMKTVIKKLQPIGEQRCELASKYRTGFFW